MDSNRDHTGMLKNVGFSLLAGGTTIRIKAGGYSMYPCIRPGSVLVIEPVKVKGLPVPGEIIAIRRENGLVVHRLIKITRKDGIAYYIARGDSNAFPDKPVRAEMIAGRVVGAMTAGARSVDISPGRKPLYMINRTRVICIILWRKVLKILR